METTNLDMFRGFYYVSSLANAYTPAKTIFLCAPDLEARSRAGLERFAKESGWLELAEEDGAVLVMPLAEEGWHKESPLLLADLYGKLRKSFQSKGGELIPGRDGVIWCWETLVYLAGYEEGAVFAGNALAATPNRFAAAALINGTPSDYTAGQYPSDHWLVPDVSADYVMKNKDIPVCLWLFCKEEDLASEALAYFSASNGISGMGIPVKYGDISSVLFKNSIEEACQIRVSVGDFMPDPSLARTIMESCFHTVIRWKNAPDGTLKCCLSKAAFYGESSFYHDQVSLNGNIYEFHTYLPEGVRENRAKGLPVVFSVHGRGEPAWIFSTKNGWDRLADETGEFVLVLPDSPQNIWLPERDRDVFSLIIDKLYETYEIDKTRVYLTGFSNGGMITRQMANYKPELFAAVSPWNAPFFDPFDELLAGGYELPCFICIGDQDEKVPLWENLDQLLENMLIANRCDPGIDQFHNPLKFIPDIVRDGSNYYTKENRYTDGDRFKTCVYNNQDGQMRVCFTIMKNMPHGAVYDESRAAWEFLKQFARPMGSKHVTVCSNKIN